MSFKFVQVNLNHSWTAFDLLKQNVLESEIKLSIISEPPINVMSSNCWFPSLDKLAAIYWNLDSPKLTGDMCRLVRSGVGFVAIKCNKFYVLSCYISPNVTTMVFEDILESINCCMNALPGPFIIGGDFNAHSVLWGSSHTNRRGALLERWAASGDLRLINKDGAFTCIRPQGSSVVDLTWASSGIFERISNWRVREDLESLSDHLYVNFEVLDKNKSYELPTNKRWNFKKMDVESFVNSLEFLATTQVSEETLRSPELYSKWITKIMKDSCNISTPIVSIRKNRRLSFWWSDEIANLRANSVKARRHLVRSRRNRILIDEAESAYRIAKRALRKAIKQAKNKSWGELIHTIDKDPWGLPYKIVLGKLRRSSPT
ncbi:uncharacterized protein LOC112637374, partial [Camponotus floridanus]|uniref:uncharacterized protein LOC112637374 n=1 Tax=Camponotus floridanus TaxID=104421 RepID=UPI000DC66F8C